MDIFAKYLNLKDSNNLVKRALTDKSYKKVYQKFMHCEYLGETNFELATYGDAVIKLAYCDIFLDRTEKLTVRKAELESDRFLVVHIGKHYNLLSYILKDPLDDSIPNNYNYDEYNNSNKNKLKYIATAVEAVVAAIFINENKDINKIINLIKTWIEF